MVLVALNKYSCVEAVPFVMVVGGGDFKPRDIIPSFSRSTWGLINR